MFLVKTFLDMIDPMAWEPESTVLEKDFLIIVLVAGIVMIFAGVTIWLVVHKKNKKCKDK